MKRGALQVWFRRQDGRVKALQVTDLQDQPVAPRDVDQRPCLIRRLGDRLLHQHMRACLEEIPGNVEVSRCGGRHAHRIDLAEQLAIVRESARAQFGGDALACLVPAIHHGNQLAIGELRVLLRVEAPQISHSDDSRSDFLHGGAIMPARDPGAVSAQLLHPHASPLGDSVAPGPRACDLRGRARLRRDSASFAHLDLWADLARALRTRRHIQLRRGFLLGPCPGQSGLLDHCPGTGGLPGIWPACSGP